MKQGMTLLQLASEVERQNETKRDFIAPSRGLAFASNGVTHLSATGLEDQPVVTDLAHNQISGHLNIPADYYRRIRESHPKLLDESVNTLLAARPADERRMVRTLDGKARAFLSDRYRRLDNFDLMAQIVPSLMQRGDLLFASANVSEDRLYLKVTSEKLCREVKKGDVVRIGLQISNSEVGKGALSVLPFSERLVCLNGMVHADYGTRRNHVGRHAEGDGQDAYALFADDTLQADDQAFFLKVRDVVSNTLSETVLDRVVGDMRAASEVRITGDVSKGIEVLGKSKGLRQDEQSSILRNLIEGGDLSMWGLANAITRTATDADSYDRASELEGIGGSLLHSENFKEFSLAG